MNSQLLLVRTSCRRSSASWLPAFLSFASQNLPLRQLSSSAKVYQKVKDINIPVPWGIIAGIEELYENYVLTVWCLARHWNWEPCPYKYPVLCLHGWKDNAATFDTLLPLLTSQLPDHQFLAIDFPGHGMSSHFPLGMIYSVQDMWILIRRIRKYFGWEKISLLSHSMGAQISFSHAGTSPDVVEKLVAIDALSPVVLTKEDTIGMVPKLNADIIKFEERLTSGKRPLYKYEDIVAKLCKAHMGGMDPESCKILMTRGVKESSPGSGLFHFTHDIRVHYMPITGISTKQVQFIARNFKSDILYIKASRGVTYTRPYIRDNMKEWLKYDDKGKRKGNLVRFVTVEGNHHLHLTDPNSVVPHIVRFFKERKEDGIIIEP